MKKKLFYAGLVTAVAAIVLSVIGSNLGANGMPQDVHPMAGAGLGLASLALFKAAELADTL